MQMEEVAEIYNALKNENRIKTLLLIDEGYSLNEIADELGMSHSGIYSYYQDLENAHMIRDADNRKELTPIGQLGVDVSKEFSERLNNRKKSYARQGMNDIAEELGYGSPIDEETLKELLKKSQSNDSG